MGTKRRIHDYYTPSSPEKLPLCRGQHCAQHNLYALHSLAKPIGHVQCDPGSLPAAHPAGLFVMMDRGQDGSQS
jgi:hypothetical protein